LNWRALDMVKLVFFVTAGRLYPFLAGKDFNILQHEHNDVIDSLLEPLQRNSSCLSLVVALLHLSVSLPGRFDGLHASEIVVGERNIRCLG
jgi:hypothetical protein